MQNRRRVVLAALPAAAALLAATANPAAAQTTAPKAPTPVAADAGAGLFVLRALPGASLDGTGSGALTGAIGLTQVTADSTKPTGQMSTATSSPFGLTVAGTSTPNPLALSQSALPDNATPTTGGFDFPAEAGPLLSGGLLQGSVQARWSTTLGPCVSPISTATTSLASLSAVNVIPAISLPTGAADLTGALGGLTDVLTNPAAGLGSLTGILTGATGAATPGASGSAAPTSGGAAPLVTTGSVVSLPDTSSATSTTQLVDVAGQQGKGIEATSSVQLADLTLFQGTSLLETSVKVISQPTLTATSTGSADTSTVQYTSPVLEVQLPGLLGVGAKPAPITLDAQNPSVSVPLTIPLLGDVLDNAAVTDLLTTLLGSLPTTLPTSLNLGVLTINLGKFTQQKDGASVGGAASLLDIALLPTDALSGLLGSALPAGTVPSSLLQIGIGEQVARASVAAGGVDCSTPAAATPTTPAPAPGAQASPTPPLAYTNAAYATIPLVWTGSALLLLGAVLVAALPRRRRASTED